MPSHHDRWCWNGKFVKRKQLNDVRATQNDKASYPCNCKMEVVWADFGRSGGPHAVNHLLERSLYRKSILSRKLFSNLVQPTSLSHISPMSIEARIKAYIWYSSLNSRVSFPKFQVVALKFKSLEVFLLLFLSGFIFKRHSMWLIQARWNCMSSSWQDQSSP